MSRESWDPRNISALIYSLEFGNMIRWEAGGWRRSQPLKVKSVEQSGDTYWVKAQSKGGTTYYLKNDIPSDHTEDTDYGEVVWMELVDTEPHF